jgi:hypothetical protein
LRIIAGGYIPGFVAHPTEPGLIYARTDTGCVYRWNAASAQWIPLTDFRSPSEYNPKGPESIALDASDPNRLYIAAGDVHVRGLPLRDPGVDGQGRDVHRLQHTLPDVREQRRAARRRAAGGDPASAGLRRTRRGRGRWR